MALVDLDGHWLEVNRPFTEIVGYSREEMAGMAIQHITHPEDLDADLENMRRLVAGRIPAYQMEKRYLHRDGHVVWVQLSASLVRDAAGKPLYGIGQIQDITESKRAAEQLRQSEQLYRAVMEQAVPGCWGSDATVARTAPESRWRSAPARSCAGRDGRSASWRMTSPSGRGCRACWSSASPPSPGCRPTSPSAPRAKAVSISWPPASWPPAPRSCAWWCWSTRTATACTWAAPPRSRTAYARALAETYRAAGPPLFAELVRSPRPSVVRGLSGRLLGDPRCAPLHRLAGDLPWDTLYSVPLISRGRALGAIQFGYAQREGPGDDEQIFLRAVADQTAVAVENARLFAEARGKAALEERQRLARELHDSVSQGLYGIALGAKTARTLLDREPSQAAAPLDYVSSLAEASLAEMRALIFELRPESLATEGLVTVLERQTTALQARHGIAVPAVLGEEPGASLEVKEALYRITQEALHNVVKHARASSVLVSLRVDGDSVVLEVHDDGQGFDAHGEFPGHLGLHTMRERATRLGGTLEVTSEPGGGTRVCAELASISPVRDGS